MKKWIAVMSFLAVMLSMAGCICQHEWAGATCTSGEVCANCGETQGEPLGHSFKSAPCTTPRTCSRCGQTDGVARGHKFKDATYYEPKTCSVCGKTEGSPLTKTYLTGSDYKKVDKLLQGEWSAYNNGVKTVYTFDDGDFECYLEVGGGRIYNSGTYKITNVDIEFYYDNGNVGYSEYEISGNQISWYFPTTN